MFDIYLAAAELRQQLQEKFAAKITTAPDFKTNAHGAQRDSFRPAGEDLSLLGFPVMVLAWLSIKQIDVKMLG